MDELLDLDTNVTYTDIQLEMYDINQQVKMASADDLIRNLKLVKAMLFSNQSNKEIDKIIRHFEEYDNLTEKQIKYLNNLFVMYQCKSWKV